MIAQLLDAAIRFVVNFATPPPAPCHTHTQQPHIQKPTMKVMMTMLKMKKKVTLVLHQKKMKMDRTKVMRGVLNVLQAQVLQVT